jgi:peptide/nickel transport system permease protein
VSVPGSTVVEAPAAPEVPRRPADGWRRLLRSPVMVAGLTLIGLVVAVAVLAPLLTPHDPQAITGRALEQPSSRHWLGTDVPGRDLFAQLVFGARASLVAAVVAGSLALAVAVFTGVFPALLGGVADDVSNRLMVFLLALPGFPLLVLIGSMAGNQRLAIILVIAFLGIPHNARILRSQTLALRHSGYIGAARGFGGGPLYVLRRHVVPAIAPLVVVNFVNWAAIAIELEAGLAFIGLGDPSGVSWGMSLNRALSQPSIYFSSMWTWWVLPPGLAITLSVLGFTFVGVALEPTFNPRWLRAS